MPDLTQNNAFLIVKFGYPPKPLPLDESKRLSEIPITKGEQIVVTESHKKHSTVVSHSNHVSVPPSSGSVVPTQMSGSEKGGRLGVGSMDSKGQGSGTSSKTADKTPVVVELQDGNGVMNHGEYKGPLTIFHQYLPFFCLKRFKFLQSSYQMTTVVYLPV